jgi:hypothetical protein
MADDENEQREKFSVRARRFREVVRNTGRRCKCDGEILELATYGREVYRQCAKCEAER